MEDDLVAAKLKEFDHHKLVVDLGKSRSSELQGFIAIHSDILGPALGGTRILNYKNKKQALRDVLLLSRAMTYKCAIAGLPFGGGKGVIIADPTTANMQSTLKSYAQAVHSLRGKFYTGEDVGLSEAQVQYMFKFSPYFIGKVGLAGDPSKYAALSVFLCIKVALRQMFGSSNIAGRTFAIKGVGKTGSELAWMLSKAGGKVVISDIDPAKVKLLLKLYPQIKAVVPGEIDQVAADVYAPCALGNDLDAKGLEKLRAHIVVGTANNQLANAKVGDLMFRKGILHVPDYIANAGGLINVADELLPGGYNRRRVISSINRLSGILRKVLQESGRQNRSPDRIADEMAEAVLARKRSAPKKSKASAKSSNRVVITAAVQSFAK